MYRVTTTKEFDKKFERLDAYIQNQIDDEIEQLKINPYVGRPLGYPFFREKKAKNYRFYYLIYEDYLAVFLITLSNKKEQRLSIEKIKQLISFYNEEIKKKLNS